MIKVNVKTATKQKPKKHKNHRKAKKCCKFHTDWRPQGSTTPNPTPPPGGGDEEAEVRVSQKVDAKQVEKLFEPGEVSS